jgi:hypothetical protein
VRPAIYTAQELRDPFRNTLPPPVKIEQAITKAQAIEKAPPPPPVLHVQGLLWGGQEPKAIINGKVYGIDDTVSQARILRIDRAGVTIEHLGKAIVYEPATGDQTQ